MFLSLLYPDEASAARAARGEGAPRVSDGVCASLGLTRMLPLSGGLSSFFTADPGVIAYRQEVFADLLRLPDLCRVLQ